MSPVYHTGACAPRTRSRDFVTLCSLRLGAAEGEGEWSMDACNAGAGHTGWKGLLITVCVGGWLWSRALAGVRCHVPRFAAHCSWPYRELFFTVVRSLALDWWSVRGSSFSLLHIKRLDKCWHWYVYLPLSSPVPLFHQLFMVDRDW